MSRLRSAEIDYGREYLERGDLQDIFWQIISFGHIGIQTEVRPAKNIHVRDGNIERI